ncbi:MAG: RluA family pseudouridine synthase [Lachnospiraceae bacterium]|nr:RluA family pseudouridine synthase [Lachnospiraceae bacterium]
MDSRIEIIYEDADIIVCHKHAGIAVQTAGIGSKDMVSELKNYLKSAAGKKEPYLGIVHRLDQPVEGVMVFAKTARAAASLSRQVEKGEGSGMRKIYQAEVVGHMEAPSGELKDYLIKDGKSNTSRVAEQAFVSSGQAKPAVLRYEVKERFEETELLEIQLLTGRHHQIRVQLSHAGCPLAGDTKYASEASALYNRKHNIRTAALKAVRLEFSHPVTGTWMVFSI